MLEPIDYMNGIMATIIVGICIITGVRIAYKYKQYKSKLFIYFGITWIGLSTIYVPLIISFYGILLFSQGLPLFGYLIIDGFIPVFILIGTNAWIILLEIKIKIRRILLLAFSINCAYTFLYFLYNAFASPWLLGYLESPLVIRYANFVALYLLFISISSIALGTIFSIQSLKSSQPEIRLKGVLLWSAYIFFFISILLGFLPITEATILLSRMSVIIGSGFYYYAFFPPKFFISYVKKRMNKKKEK